MVNQLTEEVRERLHHERVAGHGSVDEHPLQPQTAVLVHCVQDLPALRKAEIWRESKIIGG